MNNLKGIDAYIEQFDGDSRKHLTALRAMIRKALPRAQEAISYKMPAFTLDGEAIIWFAGFRSHIGFYPGAKAIEHFRKKLSRFKTAKGSVQFPLSDPLPADLIMRMVRFRARCKVT